MTPAPDLDPDLRLKRLKFRAGHRGFREADIVFGAFAEAEAASLSPGELDDFERLLEESDHAIYGWVIGREAAPAAFDTPLLQRIRAYLPRAHASLAKDA